MSLHPHPLPKCTHQPGGEWWFDLAVLQCSPINGSEEGMAFDLALSDARLTAQPSCRVLCKVL